MMLLSIPISLVLLSPSSGGLIPGLGLGAIGLASKLVALNILGTNVQSYAIARQNGWRFDWMFQPIIIGLMIASGYLSWWFGNLVSHPASLELEALIGPALLSLLLHCVVAGGLLLLAPQLAGMEKHELTAFSSRLKKRYSWS